MTNEKARFVIVLNHEAHEKGWHTDNHWCGPSAKPGGCSPHHFWEVWDTATVPPTFVGDDFGEPEDALLVRNFSWVADRLNRIAKESYAAGLEWAAGFAANHTCEEHCQCCDLTAKYLAAKAKGKL